MKIILLSGGSGKRLWPLSNDSRSKQFLKILPGPDGLPESMVQRVWRQLTAADLSHHSCMITGRAQADMIRNQLGRDISLIIEPDRRDTFAAIALAASYLLTEAACSPDETVVLMPVDPCVEDSFMHKLRELDRWVQRGRGSLVLLGVAPTHPSEKYGYIIPGEPQSHKTECLPVQRFVEKPDESQAAELIREGALWNCGVFAGKLKFFRNVLSERGLPTSYTELSEDYQVLPKRSFDYEVVEKLADVEVVPYGGYWKDLGTWNTLTEEMSDPINGKGILSHDSINTHIINELDIPIAVLGASNLVVAASPDGILVTDKASSPRIKEILDPAHGVPMYVERLWGWYKIIDYLKASNGNEVLTKRLGLHAGKSLSYHHHLKRTETWLVLAGEGYFIKDRELTHIQAGDVIQIPIGTPHSVKAISDMEIIETQAGSELLEEDIYRHLRSWDEIVEELNIRD